MSVEQRAFFPRVFAGVPWGSWVAMVAAVILTAKGEFDLAVLAHFDESIAWMFPVMIDVYVITAFHRGRRKDMVIGMLLMIFCQIAVHVLPVFITAGEKTPWGLVVAVACIAPIVVVRVKILIGRTKKEITAEQEAARQAEELAAARAQTSAARQALTHAEAVAVAAAEQAQAEIAAQAQRVQEEIAAREEAETRAAEAQAQVEIAGRELAEAEKQARAEVENLTARAAAEVENLTVRAAAQEEIAAGKQEEIRRQAREEIGRLQTAVRAAVEARDEARRHADEQTRAAGLAQGRLAEAREAAERAAAAKVSAEQRAQAHVRQVSTVAEQAEQQLREQLAEATGAAVAAERSAAELADRVRLLEAQREEARAAAERAATARVLAEQEITDLQRGRDAAFDELEKVRRQLARATEKTATAARAEVEISTRGEVEISTRPQRKSALPVPVELPDFLPVVDGVRPEKVATVLVAKAIEPEATYAEIYDLTGISTRTVGTVMRGVPEETAIEVGQQLLALAGGGKVLALTDGRAA